MVQFTVCVNGREALSKHVVVSSQVGFGEGINLSGERSGPYSLTNRFRSRRKGNDDVICLDRNGKQYIR